MLQNVKQSLETVGSHELQVAFKMGISWIANQLLASQERPCTMEQIIF
jgi:hypothetical protein